MKQRTRCSAACLLTAALLMQTGTLLPAQVQAENISYLYGDLDFDGVLTAKDLSVMKQGLLNPNVLTALQTAVCDVSADGQCTAEDSKLMQAYLLTEISEFPSGIWYTPAEEAVYNGIRTLTGTRLFEYLDRGVYAVNAGSSVFVSWRLLTSDEPDIGFNVYRTTDGVTVKLNNEVLTGGTNFTDTTADLTKNNTYFVTTVYNGVETPTDGYFTLESGASIYTKGNNGAAQIIPIHEGGTIHFVWVGDFNGDGAYDFLVDRTTDDHQKLEAYLNDGTYLWTIDLGYNSKEK